MVNAVKWLSVVAAVLSLVVIALIALYRPPHDQALINLLVGEIGAITIGHSAYRISSGKQASPLAAGAAILSGVVLAVSPYMLARFDPFLTIQLICSGVLVIAGAAALGERYLGGEEGRRTGAERIAQRSQN